MASVVYPHCSFHARPERFCLHLTLFNQVQVYVHVDFCYLSVNGAEDLSECTYFMF